jgi:hypothetical protein
MPLTTFPQKAHYLNHIAGQWFHLLQLAISSLSNIKGEGWLFVCFSLSSFVLFLLISWDFQW